MAKRQSPKHWSECKSEAEEAKWWDEHPEYVDQVIDKAVAGGTLRRGRKAIAASERAPVIPDHVDARAIRLRMKLSQSEFARRYGFSVRSLQHWEQGLRTPDSATRAYLTVIDKSPDAVRLALAS